MMYKKTDATAAQIGAGHAGAIEFPIFRGSEELGYGITDRLTVLGQVGYTYNGDIDRQGLHLGRLGLNYRILDGLETDGFVWDMYADAHLGGASKMTGKYGMVSPTAMGFSYDNYSTGQYGAWLGTKVGKTWGDLTGMLYAEAAYYFADNNTEIDVELPAGAAAPYPGAVAGTAIADMKSFTDWNIGAKFAYDFTETWTGGLGFAWKHHGNHVVESANIASDVPAPYTDAIETALESGFADKDLLDEFDEFPITVSVANRLTEMTQVALYGEYTFDRGDAGSQNTTDVKWEIGARLNIEF
jgi:hypothetical protein